jgi:hypothetical protein
MFWNGNTAIDGISGGATGRSDEAATFADSGAASSPIRIRYARIGSASRCSKRSLATNSPDRNDPPRRIKA